MFVGDSEEIEEDYRELYTLICACVRRRAFYWGCSADTWQTVIAYEAFVAKYANLQIEFSIGSADWTQCGGKMSKHERYGLSRIGTSLTSGMEI